MFRTVPNTHQALDIIEVIVPIAAEVSSKCFGNKKDGIIQSGEEGRLLEGFLGWDF